MIRIDDVRRYDRASPTEKLLALVFAMAAKEKASELRFDFRQDHPVIRVLYWVEDYLGAKGHLVALREGDLAYLHVHAEEDRLAFEATFPTPGRYRLFLQVQVEGRLHPVEFTQEVSR